MRILLVEDDAMIGQSLVRALRDADYVVDWVQDGAAALVALADPAAHYVLLLLDWNLPRHSGIEVLQRLRAGERLLPVLMLTARDATADLVAGLDAGADDYLVKPFELVELMARIRSLIRRGQGRASNLTRFGVLELDTKQHRVLLSGEPVALTAREFSLLAALMEHPGVVRSRGQLEERLYGWDRTVESNAVEVLIHTLRRKLGTLLIENVRGVGWRLREAP
jgi:two-component system response regulator QseB